MLSREKHEDDSEKTTSLSVDRIESGPGTAAIAVLLSQEGVQVNVPASFLPASARPGDVLLVTFRRDLETTRTVAEKTRELQNELKTTDPGGDIRL